ncbi:DUF5688 family protein [Lachnospiraceae bacterium NSJ-171]|jgi:hypothetical protein|uniref:DUF5688 family protein n=1 Tax=Eubacterium ventriosum TaxID=39496 RepID=UPI002671D78F|nr:DUF5688 family protein [Eubacterium ventriosum]MCJ7967320.1 DUF5688 family protein [Lachnospiraceae bacterium NSJ-171]
MNKMKRNVEEINRILKDEEFYIEYNEVQKNNVNKEAYRLIPKTQKTCSPVAYCENFENCSDNTEIAKELINIWNKGKLYEIPDIEELGSREFILKNVYPKVVANTNNELIDGQHLVFKEFLDMFVIYYVNIGADNEGTASYNVQEKMIANAGIDMEELHSQAIKNLEKEVSIKDMQDIIMNIIGITDESEFDFSQAPEENQMLVLSKKDSMYGASVILCASVLEKLDSFWNGEFVILPSSVHECISVRSDGFTLQEMKEMVMEINDTEVSPEDRLTDSVYVYRDGKLTKF